MIFYSTCDKAHTRDFVTRLPMGIYILEDFHIFWTWHQHFHVSTPGRYSTTKSCADRTSIQQAILFFEQFWCLLWSSPGKMFVSKSIKIHSKFHFCLLLSLSWSSPGISSSTRALPPLVSIRDFIFFILLLSSLDCNSLLSLKSGVSWSLTLPRPPPFPSTTSALEF